jgi:membrane protein DedA with SNARE-associated domain
MDAILQFVVRHGYSVLFASVFAQQMCLPVPSFLFLVAAGTLAGSGEMSLAVTLGLAVIACLLADLVWYEAGRRWGDQILRFIHGLALDPDAAVRRARKNFDRRGPLTLIVAKFVVGLDATAPPQAGLSGTSRLRFMAYDAVGAALWSGAYAGLGYAFCKDLHRAASYAARLGTTLAIVVLAGLAVQVGRKLVRWLGVMRDLRMARGNSEIRSSEPAGPRAPVLQRTR